MCSSVIEHTTKNKSTKITMICIRWQMHKHAHACTHAHTHTSFTTCLSTLCLTISSLAVSVLPKLQASRKQSRLSYTHKYDDAREWPTGAAWHTHSLWQVCHTHSLCPSDWDQSPVARWGTSPPWDGPHGRPSAGSSVPCCPSHTCQGQTYRTSTAPQTGVLLKQPGEGHSDHPAMEKIQKC